MLLFVFLFSGRINSQTPKVILGKMSDSLSFTVDDLLGETKSNLVVWMTKPSGMSSGLTRNHLEKNHITLFDKESFEHIRALEFPEFSNDENYELERISLERIFMNGNTLTAFISGWNTKDKSYKLYSWQFYADDLKPITERAQFLASVPRNSQETYRLFEIRKFKFSNKYGVIYNQYNRRKKT